MIPKYEKIFVLCHGGSVTGGPEAAHQLVDRLRSMGARAFVSYTPLERKFEVPEAFRVYNVEPAIPEDLPGNIIIVPETSTTLLEQFSRAKIAIWWLSVDAFFLFGGLGHSRYWWEGKIARFIGRYRRWFLPGEYNKLKMAEHFAQSQYAMNFLLRRRLKSTALSDYINVEFADHEDAPVRKDVIAYSRKGLKTAMRLMKRHPGFKWVPIQGLSRTEVRDLLSSVKLYVDFGSHPGKDRLPREAAVCGACVLTGQEGSAGFTQDLPIPQLYKLDDRSAEFSQSFGLLVKDIFSNFDRHQEAFGSYRAHILGEKARFEREIEAAFFTEVT